MLKPVGPKKYIHTERIVSQPEVVALRADLDVHIEPSEMLMVAKARLCKAKYTMSPSVLPMI